MALVLYSCGLFQQKGSNTNEPLEEKNVDCDFVFGAEKAIECAQVANDILGYTDDWPPNTNSTLFFNLIEGNQNLKSINFCYIFIDSLTSSIGQVPNLEYLQLSHGNITYIPKEIGNLKKLKSLILGTSDDECRGNKVRTVPKEIGNCESLEHLGLAFSEVNDLPKELENCKSLKIIDLSYNKIMTENKLDSLKQRLPNVEIIFK